MKKNLIVLIIVAVLATIMYLISGYSQSKITTCTLEAKICPDGSAVGRTGLNCQFAPCPATKSTPTVTPSDASIDQYECPKTNYVDCMPGPDKVNPHCNSQYLQWAESNCPDFKGAAY